jgi:hypothetical protein
VFLLRKMMEREYVFASQKGWNADEADGAG